MLNTLNYSEITQSFMSFLSSKPSWYLDFKDKYYSIDANGDMLLHNSNIIYNKLSSTTYPDRSFFRLVVNENYPLTKTFDNVEYSGDNISLMVQLHKFYTLTQNSLSIETSSIDIREDSYKFAIPRNTTTESETVSTPVVPTLIGTTRGEIGYAYLNTLYISTVLGSNAIAANLCRNYISSGNSGKLPTLGDMNAIMSNASLLGLDRNLIYLTSSERDISSAYTSTGWINKQASNQTRVRPIIYVNVPNGPSAYVVGYEIYSGWVIGYIFLPEDYGYTTDSKKLICVAKVDVGVNVPWSSLDPIETTIQVPGKFADRMRGKYLISDYSFQNNSGKMFVLPFIETKYRHSMI